MTRIAIESYITYKKDGLFASFSSLPTKPAKMIKTLILIGTLAMAAASSSHAKQDPSCMEAENVTLCEADLPICKSLFIVDRDEDTRRRIYKTCLDQNGLNHLDDVDPELLFGPTSPARCLVPRTTTKLNNEVCLAGTWSAMGFQLGVGVPPGVREKNFWAEA
ncbi:uncharacterized protein LOC122262983 [Penaeus japonicus]|uniref:uncharacterized protein LOC122262983 n=1 Tax=Penaeus japonicus TaxID=27405 RepID=UPI001C70FBDA|nr:uncharacterized protein LOC122262983 [Penaeus japonicus]